MTSAFIRLSPFLKNQTVCGLTLARYFQWLSGDYAIQVVEEEPDADLVIDARYIAIAKDTLRQALETTANVSGPTGELAIHWGRTTPEGQALQLAPHESRLVVDIASLTTVEAELRRRIAIEWIRKGVQIIDSNATYLDASVQLGSGTKIWPGAVLRGQTVVGTQCEIQAGCWIENSTLGSNVLVKPHSVCLEAVLGDHVQVGPMAHLRPGAKLDSNVKVGNFVEVKKSHLAQGAKASHLSYIGDASVGENANIGAGTITCNYDGHGKHKTQIGRGAFIGSNTALVAPVAIGDGAIVGAGSTISKDVPDNALAVERGNMRILAGKAPSLHERNRLLAAKARQKH